MRLHCTPRDLVFTNNEARFSSVVRHIYDDFFFSKIEPTRGRRPVPDTLLRRRWWSINDGVFRRRYRAGQSYQHDWLAGWLEGRTPRLGGPRSPHLIRCAAGCRAVADVIVSLSPARARDGLTRGRNPHPFTARSRESNI